VDIKIEDIIGRAIDGKNVCSACLTTSEEENTVDVDALILRDDCRVFFCARCKKEIQ